MSEAADGDAKTGGRPIRRQAVVVVHGQGEQRPMGTIRDFVKVLWKFSPEFGTDIPAEGRDVWIVPDDKSGLFELQRITTPEQDGRRTDFFELYYADLLNDTPVKNLTRWMQRLFWIDPADVPGLVRWPWTVFWCLSLVVAGLLAYLGLSLPHFLHANLLAPLWAPGAWIPVSVGVLALVVLALPKLWNGLELLERVPAALIIAVEAVIFIYLYHDRRQRSRRRPRCSCCISASPSCCPISATRPAISARRPRQCRAGRWCVTAAWRCSGRCMMTPNSTGSC